MKPPLFRSLPLIFASLFTVTSYANLSLDRMIIYFDPDKPPREDVLVSNPDAETLYLQTEVFEVRKPGTPEEERVKITDPDDLKLLATPQKAIIPANGRKTVRLVSLEAPKQIEKVYRVTFRPVVGELEATQNAIKLLIAYQALVFIRPPNPKYDVVASQNGKAMVFTNKGNINVVLRNGKYCQKKDDCTDLLEGSRIYAGEHWSLELPSEAQNGTGFIQYGLFDGKFEETARFDLKK